MHRLFSGGICQVPSPRKQDQNHSGNTRLRRKEGVNSWLKTLSRKFLQRPVLLHACPHDTRVGGLSQPSSICPSVMYKSNTFLSSAISERLSSGATNYGWQQHYDILCGFVNTPSASAVHIMLSPTSSTLLPRCLFMFLNGSFRSHGATLGCRLREAAVADDFGASTHHARGLAQGEVGLEGFGV